jgi:hypothetical protein
MLLLLPYTIILRLYSLWQPEVIITSKNDGLLSQWIMGALVDWPITSSILAILLVYIQAILINHWANQNNIQRLPSSLPGMTYILLASITPDLQQLSPALIGMTFMIMAFLEISQIYKKNDASILNFNAGFFVALAFLCSAQLLFGSLVVIIGLQVLRSFEIKESFQILIGIGVLIWTLWAAVFFFTGGKVLDFSEFGIIDGLSALWPVDLSGKISLSLFFFLIVIGLFNYYSFMKKKQIDARKKIDLVYWFLLSSLIGLIFYNQSVITYLLFAIMPISILFGMMLNNRKISTAELFHLGLLIVLVINLYGDAFGMIY